MTATNMIKRIEILENRMQPDSKTRGGEAIEAYFQVVAWYSGDQKLREYIGAIEPPSAETIALAERAPELAPEYFKNLERVYGPIAEQMQAEGKLSQPVP
jgi:hypothetical protein